MQIVIQKILRHNSRVASTFGFLTHPVQLILSLWDTPPPLPVVPTAAKLAESSANSEVVNSVAAQVTTPPGICGFIPTETGSSDWVCQAMGQVMPGLVYFVSMTVIFLTLLFLVRYFFRCLKAGTALRGLQKTLALQKSLSPHEVANSTQVEQVLSALSQWSQRLPALAPFKQKIADSLIEVKEPRSGQLLSKSIPEISEKNMDLGDWTGKNLADEIPNWLTAIGLLTTFIAILLGLQHVKVLSNLEVQGIGGLVNGLSGKFFSSIVALACALSVTITNYFLSAKLNSLWNQIILKLETLLPHLNTEQMLFDILKERQRKKSES